MQSNACYECVKLRYALGVTVSSLSSVLIAESAIFFQLYGSKDSALFLAHRFLAISLHIWVRFWSFVLHVV